MSRDQLTGALSSLVLAVVAAAYVWLSYDYDFASRALPWIAGVLAIAFVLLDVASNVNKAATRAPGNLAGNNAGRTNDPDERSVVSSPWLREAIAFAWIGAFLPLVVVLGFYAGILLYVFSYLRVYARKGALASAVAAFGLVGFLYVVFEVSMGYAIFGGLLGGDSL